ncbi:MAG: glutamate--tRNA ligase [Spongiibacteraceae bacterium]|jgi:glutamyl-tRNA synthetase|nr:glutamate--tRNA ligase [Spongiibacteraceae bacterium]
MTIRTRIAPSPTGDPHVGTAYIALFNLCFARANGGEFILRIEDTDQQRSTPQSEQAILDSLRWLGLSWSEGPDVGGPHGPYRQSERGAIYAEHTERLLQEGHAFRCFCTSERLDALRAEQMASQEPVGYDGHCLSLTQQEIAEKLNSRHPYVVRMKVPREGVCVIDDLLRGRIEIDWKQVDMQVLLKADGMPTYHLANVVDDHLMEITHVIRGEEWISSAPKHLLLYQYFGWKAPMLCHLPLLRNPDKSKLSKRKNPTSILYYQRMGFLPEALLNYLGRMGWSMPDEREKFTLDEMLEVFDINRVSLGGPIFDVEKLRWLNGVWLRELTPEQLADRLHDWALNRDNLLRILPHAQSRIETLSDFAPLTAFFVSGMLPIKPEDFSTIGLDDETLLKALQFALWRLEALQDWQRDRIFEEMKGLASGLGLKVKDFFAPLFVAIAGTTASISVIDSMALLGPDMSRARLRHAIEVLGGLGKKRLKTLEKAYAELASA